jgi:ornithine carbamoyltransferase
MASLENLLSLSDPTPEEVVEILDLADTMKANPGHYADALAGQTLAMIFEKPSLRTRVTFEAGMTQLGGHAIYLGPSDAQIGTRESVPDVAHNLERWVDGIMARTCAQTVVDLPATRTSVIVRLLAPVPRLADYMTLREVRGI